MTHINIRTTYITLLLTFSLAFNSAFCQELSASDIKPIKSATSNSYVSNQDGVLSEATCEQLNAQLATLEKKTSAQVAVVVLRTSGGKSARDLSMELFDKWKVGNKNSNNGLIIMLLVKEKDVFFRTGYGLEGALTDAKATDIVNNIMAPYLKAGQWDQGISAGVNEAVKIIYSEYNSEGFAIATKSNDKLYTFLYIYAILTVVMIIFAFVAIHSGHSKFPLSHKEEKISAFKKRMRPWLLIGILFPVMFIFVVVWYWVFFKPFVRYHKTKCPKCGKRMHLLSEKEEDSFLSKKQQLEETVKSKDYDVWLCGNCSTTNIYCYDNTLTRYSTCSFCGAKTMILASDTVVKEPTEFSCGLNKKTYHCKNCGKDLIREYETDKIAPTVIIGGIGGGSNGGGGFSGGGGSFGGGFSGGGGGGGQFAPKE
jgi:Beta-propeller domains of methanol dehydrogenase type